MAINPPPDARGGKPRVLDTTLFILVLAGTIAMLLSLAFPPPAHAADSLKAVRADYGPRIEALEAKVKALQDAAAKAATPPATTTSSAPAVTPARTYAPGVDKAGLRAVADLEFAPPGSTATPTKLAWRDPWPACVSPNRPTAGQIEVDPTGCGGVVTFDGWDLKGVDVRAMGKGTITFKNGRWSPKAGSKSYMLGVGNFDGMWNGAPDVVLENMVVDGAGQAVNGGWALLGSGSLTVTNSTVKNFGPILVNFICEAKDGRARALTMTGNLLGPIGESSFNGVAADPAKYWNGAVDYNDPTKPGGAHVEFVHTLCGGRLGITGNLIDLYGHSGQKGGGFGGMLSVQGFEGLLQGAIAGNVIRWNKGQSWSTGVVPRAPMSDLYMMASPAGGAWGSFSYDLTVTGNALQKGQSTWFARDDRPGALPPPKFVQSNNFDHDTGALVP